MKKVKLFYGIGLISIFICANHYGGGIVYGLLYLVVAIPIVALIYLQLIYGKIKMKCDHLPEVVSKNVPFFYETVVENHSALCGANVALCFSESILDPEKNNKEVFFLLPREKKQMTRLLASPYRGQFEVGIDQIIISDPFNLFDRYLAIKKKQSILVVPTLVVLGSLKGFEMLKRPFVRQMRQEGEIDNELRNYEVGDPMKTVHWKASAKKSALLSRKVLMNEEKSYELVLDCFDHSDKALEDRMIETLLAVIYFLISQGEKCHVSMGSFLEEELLTYDQLYAVQRSCAVLKFDEQKSLSEKLEEMRRMRRCIGRWLLITSYVDQRLIMTLREMTIRGERIVLYVVNDTLEKEDLEELWKVGVMSFQVNLENKLEMCLEEEKN